MNNSAPDQYKGSEFSENPFESLLDKIIIFRQRDGKESSAKLLRIQGQRLVFERRSGSIIIIHADDIVSAYELAPRRA